MSLVFTCACTCAFSGSTTAAVVFARSRLYAARTPCPYDISHTSNYRCVYASAHRAASTSPGFKLPLPPAPGTRFRVSLATSPLNQTFSCPLRAGQSFRPLVCHLELLFATQPRARPREREPPVIALALGLREDYVGRHEPILAPGEERSDPRSLADGLGLRFLRTRSGHKVGGALLLQQPRNVPQALCVGLAPHLHLRNLPRHVVDKLLAGGGGVGVFAAAEVMRWCEGEKGSEARNRGSFFAPRCCLEGQRG